MFQGSRNVLCHVGSGPRCHVGYGIKRIELIGFLARRHKRRLKGYFGCVLHLLCSHVLSLRCSILVTK